MRKLKLQTQISVDGFVADTNGKTDWMLWNWGEEWNWDDKLKNYYNEVTASVDCILLSRKMAEEGFNAHWTKLAENPQFAFAKNVTKAHKIVFTKTLHKSKWENNKIANGDLVREITKLKNQKGKDIIAYGGAGFISSLIKTGLIDEFHFIINPIAIGNGMTIFKERETKLNLTLVKAKSYDCGIVVLVYKPKTD